MIGGADELLSFPPVLFVEGGMGARVGAVDGGAVVDGFGPDIVVMGSCVGLAD